MTNLPKVVSARLGATGQPGSHPDPDLLTAFAEKSLQGEPRVQILEHLAQCVNCRDVVSLSLLQVDVAGAAMPGTGSGWLRWRGMRWAAAVACVAIAATVLIVHREGARRAEALPGRAETAVLLPGRAMPASQRPAEVSAQDSHAEAKSREGAAAKHSPTLMADARPSAEIIPGRAKDAVASPGAPKMAAPMANDLSLQGVALTPRWTLGVDGTLQRSLDSGRTWQQIAVSRSVTLRALAANGMDIWVGGASGVLYHSADAGQHWMQVLPAAQGEVLSGDIIGVEFTDLLHGKVTTTGKEIWTTADGGASWQKP
jgi:hypothetical protein